MLVGCDEPDGVQGLGDVCGLEVPEALIRVALVVEVGQEDVLDLLRGHLQGARHELFHGLLVVLQGF